MQYFKINLGGILKLIFSVTFLTSAFGKFVDLKPTIILIMTLFPLNYNGAKFLAILLSFLEILMAGLIWKRKFLLFFLIFPVIFLIFILFSHFNKLNCGCFGSLPFLSQMSLGAHLLLLAGMFLGILFLINSKKLDQESEKGIERQRFYQTAKLISFTGYIALAMMLSAFFTLPFSAQNNNVHNSSTNHKIVDRAFVEKAISNDHIIIIDARPEFQYVMGHIPNSLNIPYNTTHLDSLLQRFALKQKLLILYCSDSRCNTADILAKRLADSGYAKIAVYPGGWKDWSQ